MKSFHVIFLDEPLLDQWFEWALLIQFFTELTECYAREGGPLNPKKMDWVRTTVEMPNTVYFAAMGKRDFTTKPVCNV